MSIALCVMTAAALLAAPLGTPSAHASNETDGVLLREGFDDARTEEEAEQGYRSHDSGLGDQVSCPRLPARRRRNVAALATVDPAIVAGLVTTGLRGGPPRRYLQTMRWTLAGLLVLSLARKPFDLFTFNPWLPRLPEWLASPESPWGDKLAFLRAQCGRYSSIDEEARAAREAIVAQWLKR